MLAATRPVAEESARIEALVMRFAPLGLAEIGRAALLERVEAKYLLPARTLTALLDDLRPSYSVLVAGDSPLCRYRTLYFDTPAFDMYRLHQAGVSNRYKVRAREYVETESRFLEIKHKTNRRRTVKHRRPTPALVTEIEDEWADFVRDGCPYDAGSLLPRVWNDYYRVTLVSKTRSERVTLDLDVSFAWEGRVARLPELVIAELKQPPHSHDSEFAALMRRNGIRRVGFSKYCAGVSLLHPEAKSNKFKKKQRLLARLLEEPRHVCN